MKHLSKKNKEGKDKDKVICDHCGNDIFKSLYSDYHR